MRTALIASTILLAACTAEPAPHAAAAQAPVSAAGSEAATTARAAPTPPSSDVDPRAAASAVPAALLGWHAIVLPLHRAMVDDAVARATAAATGDDEGSRQARVLLERAREPLQPGDIDGSWRVRSIQVMGGHGFAYPWFAATISGDGTGGASHRFAKTSGSQRRTGRLYPMDGAGFVFLGARTVNEEAPRSYSRLAAADADMPGEHDSAGRLLRIGPRELLMVLDAEGDRFELYHLRR